MGTDCGEGGGEVWTWDSHLHPERLGRPCNINQEPRETMGHVGALLDREAPLTEKYLHEEKGLIGCVYRLLTPMGELCSES